MVTIDLGPRPDDDFYLASLERSGEKLADAAQRDLRAAVPSCPGWDVAELVFHTGEAHYFWSAVAERGVQDPKDLEDEELPRPDDRDLIAWFRSNLARTVTILRTTDGNKAVWSWSPEKKVAWIRRRMAHETSVHCWDAQSATGSGEPIDTSLAVDGIDEFLEFFVRPPQDKSVRLSVHLHATDTDGEWLVEVAEGRVHARRAHEKGRVAVRGRATDLLLLLWGRLPEAAVDVHGDRSSLFRFLQLADLT